MENLNSGNIIFKEVDFDPFAGVQSEPVPTTEPQKEIWTNVQIGGHAANCAYNESVSLILRGNFNLEAFRQSVRELFIRHDALRSTFSNDGLSMIILPEVNIDVPLVDFSGLDEPGCRERTEALLTGEAEFGFDLENGPLGRVTVIRMSPDLHQLVLTFHHIVCDGWSLGIIMQDLGRMYSAHASGKPFPAEPALSFRDYAFEELHYAESDENKRVENFWVEQYRNNLPAMEVPIDKQRPAVRTYNARRVDTVVNPELVERIRKAGARQGCSFVSTLVAAFEVFLHRITGLEDIVLGLPAAGQSLEGKDNLVGHAVNLLPLRASVDPMLTFNAYLKKRKPEILDAYDHQRYTFGSLINRLNIPRDPSRIPLVPVSFNVDLGITNGVEFYGCEFSFTTNPRRYENFEWFINAAGSGNELTLECTHNTDLYDTGVMQSRMQEFVVLLESIADHPDEQIAYLNILTREERNLSLVEWNSGKLAFDQEKCIHDWFEEAVSRYPSAVAVTHRGKDITYHQLNERSNKLARLLAGKGSGPEVLVGICMDRTIDMIVAMYAVLKSGGAYVPVDPSYPADRISYILSDAKAPLVITDNTSIHLVPPGDAEVICMDTVDWSRYSGENPRFQVTATNQAYNIYTSGSTGKPKGVTIEHRSVNSLTAWAGSLFTREQLDGVLGSTTICFDLSIFEIFCTLCLGGRLVLVKDALELPEVDAEAKVSFINTVPSAMSELLKMDHAVPRSARTIILCGEPLPVSLVNKIYSETSIEKVYDLYGPTEDTVYSTCMLRKPDEPASIGKIIPNESLYLLDKFMQPVPVGLPGEMFIGGAGVARGYLYRPELTSEKFLPDPFSGQPDARMYRTGDLARYRKDGNLEFIGRIDNQVKIRGFRIELGEVETVLGRHPAILEKIVVAREDVPGEKRLVAYVVPRPGTSTDVAALREYMKKELPEYMVPSLFLFLDAMPLTPNNKIDRKALPVPGAETIVASSQYEEPHTPVEEVLANIWCTVLGVERVGRNDNFFELGGHSIIAVRMFNEVEKQLGVKVQLPVIFRAPNIRELAAVISNEESSKPWSCLVPLQSKGNRKPLFCIHMHNGNIHRWRVLLKHLGPDQPVYAIQPRGLDVKQDPHHTIEEMAEYYLDIVRSVQPRGPYLLLGLCFSGMVVFEMAARLEHQGEKVAFLGMVNNYAPPENPTIYRMKTGLNKFMRLEIGEKFQFALEKNLEIGKNILTRARKLVGSGDLVEEIQVDDHQEPVGHDLRTIHSLALLNYHPTHTYHGDIALFRTGEPIEAFYNQHLGWDRLVKGAIETTVIDGCDNDTIITEEPYNTILSLKIREYLDRLNGGA